MTQPSVAQLPQIAIKVNGSLLPLALMDQLTICQVDQSLGLPDMCLLTFMDDAHNPEIVDGNLFDLGKQVEVMFPGEANSMLTVIKGEIVALEPTFSADNSIQFRVRIYDKSHRMARNRRYRSFVDMTDSDVVSTIARENGLTAQIDATTTIFPYQLQNNLTDMELLQKLALRNQRSLLFSEGVLYFRKLANLRSDTILTKKWGIDLREFRPQVSGASQVSEVAIQGWDMSNKQEFTASANSSDGMPAIGYSQTPSAATSSFGQSVYRVAGYHTPTQAAAEEIAKKLLYNINSQFVTASGSCFGDARLKAGCMVKLENVGTRFAGKYLISSAVHMYSSEGYSTEFNVSGGTEPLLSDLIGQGGSTAAQSWPGVHVALVTDNEDPMKIGRVKVKFPWLDSGVDSYWARVISAGAGDDRGNMFIPEINDEVMVAFENGDLERPYVLGGVWNGQDIAPTQPVEGGKVENRIIKTRGGHQIMFTDKSGSELIEIKDMSGNLSVLLDTANKKIVINAGGTGGLELKSSAGILLEAAQKLEFKCMELSSTSDKTELKASIDMKVSGQGSTTLESGGMTTVKGATVSIN